MKATKNKTSIIKCLWCKDEFVRTHGLQKYCSDSCYYKSVNKSRDEKRKKIVRLTVKGNEKLCSKCRLFIPFGEYFKDKTMSGGLSAICKKCTPKHAYNREKGRQVENYAIQNLTDRYVKTAIRNSSGLSKTQIPNEIIELKRTHLKLKRKIYGKGTNSTQNTVRRSP